MITIEALKEQVVTFVYSKMTELIGDTMTEKFFKPIIKMIVKNNIDKADVVLNLLADKNGNIDVISLITQYEDSLINGKEVETFGIVEIGNGKIKFNIPYFDKTITMDSSDIEELKELLTN